jgi:hypothetical protein
MKQLFSEMVLLNQLILVHALFGVVAGKAGISWGLNPMLIISLVSAAAIAWELYEWHKGYIVETYGSHRRFYLDCIGDIVAAVGFCALVIL